MTITIDEAIKELGKEIPPVPPNEWSKNTQAKALGFEALKRVVDMRTGSDIERYWLLPGETVE